jgi:membrane protease YdiL (CAAX protease family)
MHSTRFPNFWHLFLFLGITFFAFLLSAGSAVFVGRIVHVTPVVSTAVAQAAAYLIALAVASFFFPLLWNQPFLAGLSWNAAKASSALVFLGFLAGFTVQGLSIFIPHTKDLPIEELFHNHALIWFLVVFGVIIGPIFEEIVFRGFLLPAIAIAVDYLRIPRDPDPAIALERLDAWHSSSTFSTPALVTSTIVTSLLFALLHAPQLGWTWPAVALLACVSIVLCVVRLRTGSVAASSVVHMAYNLSLFISLFLATGGFRHLDRV